MDLQNTWVIIPAYNEEPVAGVVVSEVISQGYRVVLIDDGSFDQTSVVACKAGADVVRHPFNLGQGAALQTGIDYALRKNAKYLVTFDADGQHDVSNIKKMLDSHISVNADIVFGSRFLGTAENMPSFRKALLKLAVFFTRVTTGLNITDAHNGLRLMTADCAKRIRITQNRMAHASEIFSMTASMGLRYIESPVSIKYTSYSLAKGQRTSDSFAILIDLMLRVFRK